MLVLALTALVVQLAPPEGRPVAVLVVSKRPGADAWVGAISERVHGALAREGVKGLLPLDEAARQLKAAGYSDARSCQALRSCVGKLALILGPQAVVVAVDLARAGSALAVSLEAVAADQAAALARTELVIPVGAWSDEVVLPIVLFARELQQHLAAEAARDAPRAVSLEPALRPTLAPVVTAPASRPRALPWVLVGSAVAGAGAGVTLAALGAEDLATLERSIVDNGQGERVSSLSRSQLLALEQAGNAKLTAALISGLVAAALGVGSAVAFAAGN